VQRWQTTLVSTSMCFAIFEMKFMCFGSTLSYPHKEFLIPPRTKFNPHPHRKCGYPQPARVNPPRAGL